MNFVNNRGCQVYYRSKRMFINFELLLIVTQILVGMKMRKNTNKRINSILMTAILSLTFLTACIAFTSPIVTPISNELNANPPLKTATNAYGIYINEVFTGGGDWVELINRGPDCDLTGWSIQLWSTIIFNTYNFPNGFVFERDSILVITEVAGTDNATLLHCSSIDWTAGGAGLASLLDAGSNSVDHAEWNNWTLAIPPDASWTGELSAMGDLVYRISDFDTDSADDWINVSSSEATPGDLNPNQRFSHSYTEELTGPVAIFRDATPWGSYGLINITESILETYSIPYTVYNSSYMGAVDLSMFQKVVILSAQPQSFYDTLQSYVSWFEAYATAGGILEIHAADTMSDTWNGFLMPGSIDAIFGVEEDVRINHPFHPTLVNPNNITDAELDNWLNSAHGYFNQYPANAKKIMLYKNTTDPVFLEIPYGTGYILASYQPLEWGYNKSYSLLLENVLLYCPIQIDVAVGILNSAVSPAYETGTEHNDYQPLYDGLVAAGIDVSVITNAAILGGALMTIDVLILIDNNPSTAASPLVATWALAGGSVIAFDGSICFLNWAGLLPPEANGTNGNGVYWDYNAPDNGTVINNAHPVMAGYNYSEDMIGPGTWGDAEYFSDAILSNSSGPYYTPLVKSSIGSNFDLVSALDPPYAGRVVHIWNEMHWKTPSNQKMILNAIMWAGGRGRRAPAATVAILNSTVIPSYQVGVRNNKYAPIYNGLVIAGINTILIENTDILSGALASVDILILIDNLPSDAAATVVKNWALAGGSVISFDTGACFLNWAGLLPPEADNTSGIDVYWTYATPDSGRVDDHTHPVMAGYSYNEILNGIAVPDEAHYFTNAMLSSSAGPYYSSLTKDSGNNSRDVVVTLDAPYAGRSVHIWEGEHWLAADFRQLILNAITWASGTTHFGNGGGGIPGFTMLLTVFGLVTLLGIAFLRAKRRVSI